MLKFKVIYILLILLGINLTSCGTGKRDISPDPRERVKKNLEEGRGFRLDEAFSKKSSGDFEFASSNELWRASLDTIDFMPLASANYSGGLIITDWYTSGNNTDESIKITIRFLTNEIRSDALDIKIFYKICKQGTNCKISEKTSNLSAELIKKILSKATVYEKQTKDKNFRPYIMSKTKNNSD